MDPQSPFGCPGGACDRAPPDGSGNASDALAV